MKQYHKLLALPFVVSLFTSGALAQCELDKLTASDGSESDAFGAGYIFGSLTTLAGSALAVDGDTLLVGAQWHDHAGPIVGAVYVFERSGGAWIEADEWLASDASDGDAFGYAVAIDGDLAAVSAVFKSVGGTQQGAAYVFERGAGGWVEAARLTASDGAAYDWFGTSIDVAAGRVFVGAPGHDDAGMSSGAVYVFERTVIGWSETAKLLTVGGQTGDELGISVAAEGDTVVAGAYRRGTVVWGGAVLAFSYSQGAWSQVQELVPLYVAVGDQFGISVAIGDGRILAGSRFEDPSAVSPGLVYIFEPLPGGGWIEDGLLSPSDGVFGDWFGFTLAFDGERALVGSPRAETVDYSAGAAYVFERSVGWAETAKLVASDTAGYDSFGLAVAVDGESLVVGAPFHDDLGDNSGAAYVFASLCRVGTVYCSPAVPNSTGLSGTIRVFGSDVVVDNDLTLITGQLPPGQFGYFLLGSDPGMVQPPGAVGLLCLSGTLGRFNQPGNVGQGPSFELPIDLTGLPVTPPHPVQPGETWNFQCWYRDIGNANNFTDAVSVQFQ